MNRRHFLLGSATLPLGRKAIAASDRINLAIIGIRGRGRAIAGAIAGMPQANIAALCDVDETVYSRTLQAVQEKNNSKPPLVKDLRRVLDDKSIDAVAIATPDHWHGPATLLACAAGKDVYVEKPASHNLREGRLMVEAARRHNRVVQLGTQGRSRPSTVRAIERIRAGAIGKVVMAKAWDVQLRDDIGHKNDGPVPAGLDYDTWTGPALMLPFNENRFHYKWHWHWNYGTGDMGNDGVHQMDIARWALGVDVPTKISGMGKKLFFDDDQQTPDTANITYDYGDRALMFEMRIWNPYGMQDMENGVAVYGSTGWMQIGKINRTWGYRIFDKAGKLIDDQSDGRDGNEVHHFQNFFDCIRSRKRPNADIETGHKSTMLCHLGNIVARTGRNLQFHSGSETLVNDADANRFLRREYRKHWSTPKGA
ncbi:MAG: Gfo/Idh/MocA family oxidoreductase [Acidobacteria bacterium]|nr:Gfo/Idh/MocA family oxidoreductase [Acidobacteriota bacterium]